MNLTEEIVTQLSSVAIITSATVWLMKELGRSIINKDQKKYELDLNLKSEKFKSELNLTTEKFKMELGLLIEKENKLHSKRLEKIEGLYSLLTDLYNDMAVLVSMKIVTDMSPQEIVKQEFNNVKKVETSGGAFLLYYSKNKLYFDLETCRLIEDIIHLLNDSFANFSYKYIFGELSPSYEIQQIKEANEIIKEKIPKIKTELEDNFRKIIGVEK